MMSTDPRRREWEPRLLSALARQDIAQVAVLLSEVHAADVAALFATFDAREQQLILEALSDEQVAELLDELDPDERAQALDLLSIERTSDILEEMPSDEAADLLSELSTAEADALLERMEPEMADDVAELLRYSDDTAGGLMAKEFVRVAPEQTVAEVMALLRRHHDDAEMIYYLYVLDEEDRLLGIVTLRKLIVTDPATPISEIMGREFISVAADAPQERVAEAVRRHDLLAVPVLGSDGRMLGIVTVDDIGDVVREEAAEDLLEMSGTEEMPETPGARIGPRGWRSGLIAIGMSVLIAFAVRVFSSYLSNWSTVALLLPLLLVLGITAGSQAAMNMDHVYDEAPERQHPGRAFAREVLAGVLVAFVGGLLAGVLLLSLRYSLTTAIGTAFPVASGLWVASIAAAAGANALRRRGGRLGTVSHTAIVSASVLLGVVMYLLAAQWLALSASHPRV